MKKNENDTINTHLFLLRIKSLEVKKRTKFNNLSDQKYEKLICIPKHDAIHIFTLSSTGLDPSFPDG